MNDTDARIDHEIIAERRSGTDRRAVHGDHCIAPETGLPACGSPGEHSQGYVNATPTLGRVGSVVPAYRHEHGPLCAGLGLHRHVVNAAGRLTGFPMTEAEARLIDGNR